MTDNGIDFLLAQHREVERLLDLVAAAPPEARQDLFDELRRLLAVHETAEELVLRPLTRSSVPEGETIADARIAEENQSKDALAELEKLDAASPAFADAFVTFAREVRKHAHNEELFEFSLLAENAGPAQLTGLREGLAKAEASAPTHPHTTARSTTANAVLGPFAAMVDRVRDALR